jgi:hypothetical protein
VNLWRRNLLTNEDARELNNKGRLPVFVMMTCLNGYFNDPVLNSLGEALLKAEAGGAVAVWASSGMTLPDGQATMNQQIVRLLFQSQGRRRWVTRHEPRSWQSVTATSGGRGYCSVTPPCSSSNHLFRFR